MRRPSTTTITMAATASLVVVAAAIAVVTIKHYYGHAAAAGPPAAQAAGVSPSGSSPSPNVPKVVEAALPSTGFSYLGVYEGSDTSVGQYAQVDQFAQAIGRQPNIVMYYSGW